MKLYGLFYSFHGRQDALQNQSGGLHVASKGCAKPGNFGLSWRSAFWVACLAGLVMAAKGGDVQAARLILERILPPVKAVEQAVELQLPADGTPTAKASAVLSAAAAGELAPGQAAQLIAAPGTLAKINEVDELAARITSLEEKQNVKS